MSTSKELWLCLHFPQLPVEIFSRGQEGAVVVLTHQRVTFLNRSACDIGIQPGSSMNTAYTISDQVVSFERDETRELKTLEHLAQLAFEFTPSVSIRTPHSLLLEVSGCLKLFHGLAGLKTAIQSKLEPLGFTTVIGINGTPLSALCYAEAGIGENTGDIRASLSRVPIRCLRIEEAAIESLKQMGISDCGQLFKLPVDGLNRRFGVFFTDYLARLTGERPDPQKHISDKPFFSSEITFLTDVTNLSSLAFPVKRLLGELQTFLRGRQLLVNRFSLRLSHRSHPARDITVLLANPDNDAAMFLMLAQLKLDNISDMPETDNVSLTARTFFETEAPSGDLFQGTQFQQKDGRVHSKAEEARAVRLINMMTARLGPQACFGLSLANDHRPELAWKPVALHTRDYWHEESIGGNARPLYLLSKPTMISERNSRPFMSGELTLFQGPERIDFGWWDDHEINRDYFIARHECGALYWVYQTANSQWYLHGIFS
ncbi:MAG: DNA polymerase Y family protein [Gammaproteobacteria bacterium]|jgi:protein ImuB|nr:DNA polymerase Y family protein [Gammaproteobacteria bacterium]MBT4494962.1 DNA polymerase Y family protein [Gammaproteobacteria bacterium]MBT7370686.1 DNA polymerase Y family protein [Gammaproteobacteria bacterium]